MSELSEAISEMRNMRESYDQLAATADLYQQGRTALASAITAKGVPTTADTPLADMAQNIGDIQQQTIEVTAPNWYGGQLSGDGVLWDLYAILAQMKNRFMGNGDYAALIVCEYYKGYDSLVLQGADAYYTCDGDYYDYASPTHVWHDADNGKANRWVAFLYRDEGARLDITNTAISPRSMYIGGHIGTIEYFVNGRLTELVCGIEETDVVDNFLSKTYTQSWGFNTVFKNVKNVGNQLVCQSEGIIDLGDISADGAVVAGSGNSYRFLNASYVSLKGIKHIMNPQLPDGPLIYVGASKCLTVDISGVETMHLNNGYIISTDSKNVSSNMLQNILADSIVSITGISVFNKFFPKYITGSLIKLKIGAATTSLDFRNWEPVNVLADATKKAQLIDNIKNHILARVSDRTGLSRLTFTISTNMYNAVSGETITWNDEEMTLADAFLTKNWLLAGA